MKRSFEEIEEYLRSKDTQERYLGLILSGDQRELGAVPHATHALLFDENDENRAMAAWALDQICSPVTVPALIDALYDSTFEVRSNAGWALVSIAKRTIPNVVIPDVVDVMRGADRHEIRHMAYLVLYHIGGDLAQEAIRKYWER